MQLFNFTPKASKKAAVPSLPPSARTAEMEAAILRWEEIFLGQGDWRSPKRPRTLALAASCSQYLSRLICGELELSLGDSPRAKFLKAAFDKEVAPQLPMALQQALATGSVALKPYVEGDKLKLEWLGSHSFYPAAGGGMVFLSRSAANGKEYLRSEYHRFAEGRYCISSAAYACDPAGRPTHPVDLSKVPAWKDSPAELAIEGLEQPLYAIWRLPLANTVDGSAEAVGLFANGEGLLRDMDRLYNDYCFEFETARRKVILREDTLRMKRDGSPVLPHWEHADDVFLPLDFGGDSQPFSDYSPAIREQPYREALNQLLRLFERSCGLSEGTFSLGEKGAITATQVISQDRRTYYTVREIQTQGKAAMEELLSAMDALCSLYGIGGEGAYEATVTFGDGIFEDSAVEFERRLKLVDLGMKPELLLSWYFGSSEEGAKQMMKGSE